jgi:ABC-type phosphate transport system ATPase subunit
VQLDELESDAERRVVELIEAGPTSQIFTNPRVERTQDYITGRFG